MVGDERGGVVDQTLTPEDRLDPRRDTQTLQNRFGRHGVGRRYDRTEREGRRPRQTRNESMRDPRDNRGRHENEADGEKKNRAQIAPEIPPRSEEGRGIEERRKKEEED